jgi:hypothetical protein
LSAMSVIGIRIYWKGKLANSMGIALITLHPQNCKRGTRLVVIAAISRVSTSTLIIIAAAAVPRRAIRVLVAAALACTGRPVGVIIIIALTATARGSELAGAVVSRTIGRGLGSRAVRVIVVIAPTATARGSELAGAVVSRAIGRGLGSRAVSVIIASPVRGAAGVGARRGVIAATTALAR